MNLAAREIEERELQEKDKRCIQYFDELAQLKKENELLKSKIENVCSQYVSNELAYKIKEIIRNI